MPSLSHRPFQRARSVPSPARHTPPGLGYGDSWIVACLGKEAWCRLAQDHRRMNYGDSWIVTCLGREEARRSMGARAKLWSQSPSSMLQIWSVDEELP